MAWKKAIEQAYVNNLAFDYVYILMPPGGFMVKACEEARSRGVGVLVADESIIINAVKPKWQRRPFPPIYRKAKEYIRSINIHNRRRF